MNHKDTSDFDADKTKISANDEYAYFNEAMLIDENGKEIPITEEMIQQACNELLEAIN